MTTVENLARNMAAHDANCPVGQEFDKFGRVAEEKLQRAIDMSDPGTPKHYLAVRQLLRWKRRREKWWQGLI